MLDAFDFSEIQAYLNALEGAGRQLSFVELLELLMSGKWQEACTLLFDSVKTALFAEFSSGGRIFVQLLLIGIAAAVFANFTSVFEKSQIAQAGFYITYLLLFSLLAAGFLNGLNIAMRAVERVTGFMKVLLPAYFMAVAFSGNAGTALVSYEASLFFIFVLEKLLQLILIPMLKIYIFLVLAGHICEEDLLSRMRELTEKCIQWGMKTLLGAVVGFQILQGLLLPYADAVKTGGVQKVLSVVPGVGQAAGAAMQLLLGSGVLIKNTIGVGAMAILALICLLPIVKLCTFMLFYSFAAAILQPVCDKRMVSCIAESAHGYRLLLGMVLTVCTLFFITIALVCASSNVSYFSG
ncbi:MAG: stage III sporulation protein AE [bacterium]|nr:stage III sporulation protein AE [bacterium]